MWIERVVLRQIKSFEKADIELTKGINIIIGDNNSGKSTIIRTIDRLQGRSHNSEGLVRNGKDYGYGEFIFKDGESKYFGEEIILKEESPIAIKGYKSLKNLNFQKVILFANREKSYLGQVVDINEMGPNMENIFDIQIDEQSNLRSNNLIPFKNFPDQEPDNAFYASYSRRGYYDGQISQDNTHRIRQDLGNLTARLQKLDNGNHPNHKPFKRACKKILGFEPGAIAHGDSGSNLIIGIYTDNTNTINVNNMGQGVSHVLGLLTILYTQKNKIILLEEIENDLHPKVLKQLLDLVIEKSQNNNQFIISTHSNIVLKYLGSQDSSKIFKTSWGMKKFGGQNLPLSRIQEIPNNPESRIELLQEMGYDVMDFELWQGYILFEESTTELFVRDYFIPVFAPELKNRVRTISSKGVDDVGPRFKGFLSLFVFIHLTGLYKHKAWTIVDGDEAGLKVVRDLKKTYSSWNEKHFIALTKPDFELYYPKKFEKKVNEILKMPKGQHKQLAKVELRKSILAWSLEDIESSKKEFRKSAPELIAILGSIEKHFKN